jgi:hypothetical protein
MYIQEKNTTEDLAVWARPFAFHSYGELTKKKKLAHAATSDVRCISFEPHQTIILKVNGLQKHEL